MDEIYIKQCDCPEIQGQWEPKEGDRYFSSIECGCEVVGLIPRDLSLYMKEKAKNGVVTWLPRQEDWQNILFSQHYAPAIPSTAEKVRGAMIIMHREFVDYMEAWKIDQPCEAWARLYMNRAHNKTWTEEGWV